MRAAVRARRQVGLKVTPRRLHQTPTGTKKREATQVNLLTLPSVVFLSRPPLPRPLPSACWVTPLCTGTDHTPRPPRDMEARGTCSSFLGTQSFRHDDKPLDLDANQQHEKDRSDETPCNAKETTHGAQVLPEPPTRAAGGGRVHVGWQKVGWRVRAGGGSGVLAPDGDGVSGWEDEQPWRREWRWWHNDANARNATDSYAESG